jgi:hypothetical protein
MGLDHPLLSRKKRFLEMYFVRFLALLARRVFGFDAWSGIKD